MSEKAYEAGVKEYREKYWAPEYVPLDTDLLACFKSYRPARCTERRSGSSGCGGKFNRYLEYGMV